MTCGASRGFHRSFVSLVTLITALAVAAPADARRHARHTAAGQASQPSHARHRGHHGVRESGYNPPSAAIVVDANSGKTLQEKNADSPRHPASLTKIMTLYLLFEQLEAGKMTLSTMMPVSERAADQAPTKLELRAGQKIEVEDAIRGLVTRSANDAAVVIAEAIGGDEATFAKMMTRKARALGMSRTSYVNASGLPDDDQVTTARDQALLGRAIQERFPRYYRYFSTISFVFHGEEIRNHNHLLGRVDGVDGIKTGYTRSSGFNLVTSVRRNGRHIVAVVLGGSSAGERDARMRNLIEQHITAASTRHTATMIADAGEPSQAQAQAANAGGRYGLSSTGTVPVAPSGAASAKNQGQNPQDQAQNAAAGKRRPPVGSSEPIKPIAVKTIKVKLAPVQTATLAPAAVMIPVSEAATSPATATPAAAAPAAAMPAAQPEPVAQPAAATQPAQATQPTPANQPTPAAQPTQAAQPAQAAQPTQAAKPAPPPWVEAKADTIKREA